MVSISISFSLTRCGPKGFPTKYAKERAAQAKAKKKASMLAHKKLLELPVKPPSWEATCCTRLPVREEFTYSNIDLGNHSWRELTLSQWFDRGNIDAEKKNDQSFNAATIVSNELDWSSVEASDGENDCKSDRDELDGGEDSADEQGEVEDSLEGVDTNNLIQQKRVPAVMRCFDRAKIWVKAGDGGNGAVAFRREKYVAEGGPSGGNGGAGGNVYVEVDEDMNSLLAFRNKLHFKAGRGGNGQGKKQHGAAGEDVVVKSAPGTVIREVDKNGDAGEVLVEMLNVGERVLLISGGKGGRGNASFRCGTNTVPRIAENGEEGRETWLELELKLVADVGIIGVPNAGKSTFLSAISDAQPNIASYPYTTLLPNLGVVSFDYGATLVAADLPGLLEGAHRGFGLGHEFLRHTERCSVLVHVIDGSSPQPDYEFDAVRLELEMFNPKLREKPYLVAYNKMDLPEANEKWLSFKDTLKARGIDCFCMSALSRDGTFQVIKSAYQLFQKIKAAKKFEGTRPPEHVVDLKKRQKTPSIKEFTVSHDGASNTWQVTGAGLERFVQMTNWSYVESKLRLQHVMEASGLSRYLVKKGVKGGDIIMIGDKPIPWHDYKDGSNPPAVVRRSSYSVT